MVKNNIKVAVVTEWLETYAGSEKVVEQILKVYPHADLFSVVDFLPEDQRKFINGKKITTTFIQHLPFSKRKFRAYLPLMPFAIEQLDLSDYDLIISSSHAVAKGVITGPDQLHICYCHSPIRYAWDFQHEYLRESGLDKGLKGLIARYILHKIRIWDYRTANGVDFFISNSNFIKRRIWKVYRRDATVIYPPVDVDDFTFQKEKKEYYVTASRMVPYKKMGLIVEAFSKMPDKKLYVIGDGPEYKNIKEKATDNIVLLGYQNFDSMHRYMKNARAFVFASEEDFGITPVEAQSCGTPVIAYGKGGSLETIRGIDEEKTTGLFFYHQTTESLINAVKEFENNYSKFQAINCRENALNFSEEKFREKFKKFVEVQTQRKWGR
ncbi:glycosyltransferase family 4 protein [Sporolactobacillus vineae]|uniref:glycosyltransferase family 4 protein n=1 Tax=Sporolactobacillus vineae TaxID=444463 RepID=UPI0002897607|nr:glycosyltransferase family 4 protein [Sporolactobacillus vineae]